MQVSDVSTPRVFAGDTSGWPPLLGVIIVVVALLRLLWAVTIPMDPVSDGHAYNVFAINMVEHGVYGWTPDNPTAYWAVGTSAAVAATYLLLGQSYAGVVALNLLAGLLMALTYIGGELAQLMLGVPGAAIQLFQGMLLFFLLATDVFSNYRLRLAKKEVA